MKPPADCSPECASWFAASAQAQRQTIELNRRYATGLKRELRKRFQMRLAMLRNPTL